jgi:hypothetical protein
MGVSARVVFDDLNVEALALIANESAEQVESSARKTVEHAERCGRALLAAKQKVPHGQWLGWLAKNFDYNQQHASRYITIAANYSRVSNLKEATSLREALRMIAEDPETPKRERKPSVEVIEHIEAQATSVKEQKPASEKTLGETATNAVSREETRKADTHRPPENFTPVTPSYKDEDPKAVPMRLESGFDDVAATKRIRTFIENEIAKWPEDRIGEAVQVFQLYLGNYEL